jgi:hypothetical protein
MKKLLKTGWQVSTTADIKTTKTTKTMKKQFITEARRFQKLAGIINESKVLNEAVTLDGKQVDINSIEIDNIDMEDFPDFSDAQISYAEYTDGTELSEDELMRLEDENYGITNELIHDKQLYNR